MAKRQTHSNPAPPRFVRAANLELDHRDPRALDGYMLTSGARRVLNRVAPSVIDPAAPRAWTLTGPYGTGKSSFAVFVSQLLSTKSSPGSAQARAILREGDEDLAEKIPAYSKQFRGLVPVAVTGSREPLQVSLLRALKTALANLDGASQASLARRVNKLLDQAESADGLNDRDLLDAMSATAEAASRSGVASGVLVVIDEFGKLLEFAATHPNRSDVYVLQHLAELAARSDVPILVLTILHKDFSGYADRLSSHEKAEWEKVRGRFEDIVFEESADEVLRLVALARNSTDEANAGLFAQKLADHKMQEFEELASQAWRLQLAPPGIAKNEFASLLKQCWPLHPLVAVLVGPVFRKLSQNERSVFSFLSSREPHGLFDFLSSERDSSDVYGLDRLYDYLWNSLGEGLYSQRNGKKWAEVESALERFVDATPAAVVVLKMIGVISAIGGTKNIQATPDVIRFGATGIIQPSDVSSAVKLLEGASVITLRKYNNTLSLWEGSDVDIDERVKVARERGDFSAIATLASRYVPLRPIVARRHSFETGTLRYFTVEFIEPLSLAAEVGKSSEADGRVLVTLPANDDQRAVVAEVAKSEAVAKQKKVLIVVAGESRNIEMCLRELACLEWVRDNTPELAGDLTARRELRAREADLHRQLDTLAANMLVPVSQTDARGVWFYAGRSIAVSSRRALNDHFSDILKKVFSATPRILNELVNRRELSSAAAAARRNLIEFMINRADQPALGIEGFPPEKSMYLSVLATHGLHQQGADGWEFGPPRIEGDPGMLKVWKAIQSFFDSTEKLPRTAESLFIELRDEPFGLRDGVLPVIFCAALIANESDVALYEEGTFVPQLVVPVFERLMKAAAKFTVRRWRISGVRETVFRQLAELLGRNWGAASITKRNVLDVVRPLLKFVQQLPDYTKATEQISEQAKRVRDALLQAREPDQLLFVELPRACRLQPIEPDDKISDEVLHVFLSELKQSLSELQRHYDMTIVDLGKAMGSVFGVEGANAVVRKRLTARAEIVREWVADPALKNFVARVLDSSADEQAWIESVAALLSERPTRVWRDTDRAKFDLVLNRVSRMFRHVEVLASDSNGAANGHTESLRIGITTRDGGDVEEVVHIGPDEQVKLDEVTRRLCDAIDASDMYGRREVLLAALVKIARKVLT